MLVRDSYCLSRSIIECSIVTTTIQGAVKCTIMSTEVQSPLHNELICNLYYIAVYQTIVYTVFSTASGTVLGTLYNVQNIPQFNV